jgi:hypothetical protein
MRTADIRTFTSSVLVRKYRISRGTSSSIQVVHLLPYFEFKILQHDGSTCPPLRRDVKNVSAAYPPFTQSVPGSISPWVKRLGCEDNHQLPYSDDVKNEKSYTPVPLTCLHDVCRENLAFF